MRVTHLLTYWVSVSIDFTDVNLVSEDTYKRLYWCDPDDADDHDGPDEPDDHDNPDDSDDHDDHFFYPKTFLTRKTFLTQNTFLT